jgi:DnaJ-class molecular chaperone
MGFLVHQPNILSQQTQSPPNNIQLRPYFTNTDQLKKTDPYAILGITWGASLSEIKTAYHNQARQLHPDVTKLDPSEALEQFKLVKNAYEALMGNSSENDSEWAFSIWRNSDIIAQNRTDVAGLKRKRPKKPADSFKNGWGVRQIGHPDGRGVSTSRGEYLANGQRSSTVGTGQNKWVKKKEYKPWNPKG